MSNNDAPCGGRDYCGRFPFCGCGRPDQLPERDHAKTNAEQGLYRKFSVTRTDGSSEPGGKHHGCEYFVLDVTHDPHAHAALAAYAAAVEATHPALAADMRDHYGLAGAPDLLALLGRCAERLSYFDTPCQALAAEVRAVIAKFTERPDSHTP